jgi:hypothetical protein
VDLVDDQTADLGNDAAQRPVSADRLEFLRGGDPDVGPADQFGVRGVLAGERVDPDALPPPVVQFAVEFVGERPLGDEPGRLAAPCVGPQYRHHADGCFLPAPVGATTIT